MSNLTFISDLEVEGTVWKAVRKDQNLGIFNEDVPELKIWIPLPESFDVHLLVKSTDTMNGCIIRDLNWEKKRNLTKSPNITW